MFTSLAAVKASLAFDLATGLAGAAASLLVALAAGDPPVMEWLARAIIALAKIMIAFPAGQQLGINDLIVILFGKEIAKTSEEIVRTIANYPQFFSMFKDLLKWAITLYLVVMPVGFVSYWLVYAKQSSKSHSMMERIWGGRTLLVPPHLWLFSRVVPVTALVVISDLALFYFVEGMWQAVNWIVAFVYESQGTTMGQAFESNLSAMAGGGVIGLIFFLIILAFLFGAAFRFLRAYVPDLIKMLVNIFPFAIQMGLYLDGSKLRSLTEPLKKLLTPTFHVGIRSAVLLLAPGLAARVAGLPVIGGVAVAFVLVSILEVGADYPRFFAEWVMPRAQTLAEKLGERWDHLGDWIDKPVMKSARERMMFLNTENAEVAADAGTPIPSKATRIATSLIAPEVEGARGFLREGLFGSGVNEAQTANPQMDRDYARAQRVAQNESLYAQTVGLSDDKSYALFFGLVKTFESPQIEKMDVVKARVQAYVDNLSQDELQKYAEKGMKVARIAKEIKGEQPNPSDMGA